jgi:hypothetical protein
MKIGEEKRRGGFYVLPPLRSPHGVHCLEEVG